MNKVVTTDSIHVTREEEDQEGTEEGGSQGRQEGGGR
jgi:hypothetical protein